MDIKDQRKITQWPWENRKRNTKNIKNKKGRRAKKSYKYYNVLWFVLNVGFKWDEKKADVKVCVDGEWEIKKAVKQSADLVREGGESLKYTYSNKINQSRRITS